MSNTQLLAGFHAINARIKHAPNSIKEIYFDSSRRDARMQSLLDKARECNLKIYGVDIQRLDSLAKGIKHQGVVAIATTQQLAVNVDDVLDVITEPAFLLILDGVTDPHNLGACLRTADAVGVHAVIAPKDKSVGLNATVQRVACGAAETVPYIMVTNLARTMRSLKERGVWLIGTSDAADSSIYDIDAKLPTAWVMGAEGDGMRRLTSETCDQLVSIPMMGSVESLNVSVASAVCLYETLRQRSQ
ncbi:putative tRNA/rRNA methyltransferase [Taylorella asinigenitalis 14/45]|uniref:23S rRNA (guanosine-2'-O-)-methyltransferase RlmB n=1 Tax=Taylorella asinigenitalis 14/45 TaxID=1091495 RepID=I7JLF0_9BURK|nr:23S rRNA (guanosine(2251)-2'-O)-methyltransferase RlmB [Taylorella asinigenitalis]CCG18952.1 putative tRNA/rRNA methyltransferase [Taylorella asinigenitalis 14/45]